MNNVVDGSEVAIEFINADAGFFESLGVVFSEEEIAEENSFSGAEIITLIGEWSAGFVENLANFLIDKKKTEAARTIRIKIGNNELELVGFGGEDIESMKTGLNDLVAQLRQT